MQCVGTDRDLEWEVGDNRHDHLLHHDGAEEDFESVTRTALLSHGDFGQLRDQVLTVVSGEAQGDRFEGVGDAVEAADEVEVQGLSLHS